MRPMQAIVGPVPVTCADARHALKVHRSIFRPPKFSGIMVFNVTSLHTSPLRKSSALEDVPFGHLMRETRFVMSPISPV